MNSLGLGLHDASSTIALQPRVRGFPASPVAGAVRAGGGRRRAAPPLHVDDGEAAADHQDDDARAADRADGRDDDEDADARQRHGEDCGEPVGFQKTSGTPHSLSCIGKYGHSCVMQPIVIVLLLLKYSGSKDMARKKANAIARPTET